MSQGPLAPPPPTGQPIDGWLYLLWKRISSGGQLLWSYLDFSGSNLTDIATRNHVDLQNHNTTDYYHLTQANHTDLTDAGDSTLHYHATDRARANHTGTQTAATISDFAEVAQDSVGAILTDSASVDFTYDDATPSISAAVIGRHLLHGIGHNTDGTYDTTLTYNETTRTVTVTPTGASFNVYIDGVRYTKTAESIVHSAVGASQFVYYDETGTLVTGTTPWDTLTHAPICFIFQDVTNSRRIPFEERHHAERDRYWHRNQHFAEGTKATSGFSATDISGYTLATNGDAACTFALATGRLEDEDIRVDTEVVPDNGPYNILERNGASGEWQLTRTNVVPFKRSGTVLQYNLNTAGTWSLATVTNGDYVNYYVFGLTALPVGSITPTPADTQQIIIVPGQAFFASIAGASAETVASISWGTIPFQEIVPLYKLTYNYHSAAGGEVSLEAVTRVIGTAVSITAATVTDHGSLTGLTDDDHSQYLLTVDATSRATFAANWTDLTDGGATTLHTHAVGPATAVDIVDAGGDATTFLMLATAATGTLTPATDAGLSYDATTNILTVTGGVSTPDLVATNSITLASGKRLNLDGSAVGDTYIFESSADVIDIYTGGVRCFAFNPLGIDLLENFIGYKLACFGGGGLNSAIGITVNHTALAGVEQFGVSSNIASTSAATQKTVAFQAYPRTAASAYTSVNVIGFYAVDPIKGATSAITNAHGLYIADQTQGTNNYGITSLVSSGTNKWNVYASGTAANYLAGVVNLEDGTAALPALVNLGDPNTGIWFPAADTVGVSTAGVQRVNVGSTGHVGVATTDPTYGYAWGTAPRILGIVGDGTDSQASYGVLNLGNNRATPGVGDYLGVLGFSSVNDTAGHSLKAYIEAHPSGSGGATGGRGGYLAFWTRADNTATLAERLRISSAGLLTGTAVAGTGAYSHIFSNPSTAASAYAGWTVANAGTNATGLSMFVMGTAWTTSGAYVQDGSVLDSGSSLSGGLSVIAQAGGLRVYTGGVADSNERFRITNGGLVANRQPTPTAKSGVATLTIAELGTLIITASGTSYTLTLPTGTDTDAGALIATDLAFEWSIISTASGTVTLAANTNHTIVGTATIATLASARWRTRRTAANTYVTYRIA